MAMIFEANRTTSTVGPLVRRPATLHPCPAGNGKWGGKVAPGGPPAGLFGCLEKHRRIGLTVDCFTANVEGLVRT